VLYCITVDSEKVGHLYGKNETEAIDKAKFIWKLTGRVNAKAVL